MVCLVLVRISSSESLVAFILNVYVICVHKCRCVCATVYVWRSEDNLQKLVLSFHHVCCRNRTQVIKSVSSIEPTHWSQTCSHLREVKKGWAGKIKDGSVAKHLLLLQSI